MSKPSQPQVFRFSFSEEDYWKIYEPTHDRHASFFAMKPADIYWKMALVALAIAPFLFFFLPHIYQFLTALATFMAVFFILAGTLLSLKADTSMRNIRTYYHYLEGGMLVKVAEATITFETKLETRIMNGQQIKEVRFRDHFVEVTFFEGPSVIFPVSPACRSVAADFQQAVESMSAAFWTMNNAQPGTGQ